MNKTLKYISPAKSFTEALPLGNGSLGAMVYGGVPEEKITLNYDTFWSGTGHREEKEIDSSTLEQARKLIFEEKFWEADDYIQCGDYCIDGGYEAMMRLCKLQKRPTAIFISNYDMTIGAYLAINYLRLKIPDDISVIGFDNFPLANVVNPPLSFAEQPTNVMGTEAGKLLYRRICGDYSDYPKTIMHKPTMHYKESIRQLT